MATFRLLVAVSISLYFVIYEGDMNTTYLNALLGIKQYLSELEGYTCDNREMVYVIHKALYEPKQSGREWNTEVNRWFLDYGFKRCQTDPCLYYYSCEDKLLASVLLFVDDILCATTNVEFKQRCFANWSQITG